LKETCRIFLSYARQDEPKVKRLYKKLADKGYNPWMDTIDLQSGERRSSFIEDIIKQSDFFLACLTSRSINRKGVLQKDLHTDLESIKKNRYTDIYLIPIRLEDCKVPQILSEFQWVSLYERGGMARLLGAIGSQMQMQKEWEKVIHKKHSLIVKSDSAGKRRIKPKKRVPRKLTLGKLALYQKLEELIYRTRNKARDILEELQRSKSLNKKYINQLSRLKNELLEFILNERYFLDLFSCFVVVHSYKNVLVAFHTVVIAKPMPLSYQRFGNRWHVRDFECDLLRSDKGYQRGLVQAKKI